ncbi:hypothetical protein GCM10010276_05030 [Streptomyces longisporus]|uniref:Uncharacterized protein n=1 Tax=Streptomyces longisporus TaxID=1948 RepID=A0ABP5Y3W9_STRLO
MVEADLRAAPERLPDGVPGLVRGGEEIGLPGGLRPVRAAGRELIVVAPTQGMIPALLPRVLALGTEPGTDLLLRGGPEHPCRRRR